jgi:hypothetical protein
MAAVDHADLVGVEIHTNHKVSAPCQARRRDTPDVAQSKNSDVHEDSLSVKTRALKVSEPWQAAGGVVAHRARGSTRA